MYLIVFTISTLWIVNDSTAMLTIPRLHHILYVAYEIYSFSWKYFSHLGSENFFPPYKTHANSWSSQEVLIAFSSLFVRDIAYVSVLKNFVKLSSSAVFISALVQLKILGGAVCVLVMNTKSRGGVSSGSSTYKWVLIYTSMHNDWGRQSVPS